MREPPARPVRRVSEADRLAVAKAAKRHERISRWKRFWRRNSPAAFLRRVFSGKRGPEPESTADVFAPVRRGPSSRSGAVALDEPPELRRIDVRGKYQR